MPRNNFKTSKTSENPIIRGFFQLLVIIQSYLVRVDYHFIYFHFYLPVIYNTQIEMKINYMQNIFMLEEVMLYINLYHNCFKHEYVTDQWKRGHAPTRAYDTHMCQQKNIGDTHTCPDTNKRKQ